VLQQYCAKFADSESITLFGPEKFPAVGGENNEPVIFVDGGTKYRVGGEGISVGDGDSFTATDKQSELDVILPRAKDYSDFAFVLRSLPDSIRRVQTFGFMGGRTDHQVINFGEAHHFLRLRTETVLTFDHEAWGLSPGVWRPRIQGLFSIINFEACDIRVEGLCDYQIKEAVKLQAVTSRGLSNFGHGQIEIECSGPVFILPERRLHIDSAKADFRDEIF
jgi:thiamine pyrophosphokinase